jgi:hypothetical protein
VDSFLFCFGHKKKVSVLLELNSVSSFEAMESAVDRIVDKTQYYAIF